MPVRVVIPSTTNDASRPSPGVAGLPFGRRSQWAQRCLHYCDSASDLFSVALRRRCRFEVRCLAVVYRRRAGDDVVMGAYRQRGKAGSKPVATLRGGHVRDDDGGGTSEHHAPERPRQTERGIAFSALAPRECFRPPHLIGPAEAAGARQRRELGWVAAA
jgi:hypothetical protein